MLKTLTRLIVKYYAFVGILGTLLGFIGTYYTILLYQNLRTDVEELLPSTARSIVDLNEVTRRLDAIDNIVTLIFSKDTKASKKFVTDLAENLNRVPKKIVSSIEYRIDREIQFFSDRRALLMELPDLEKVNHFVHDRIDYEKELYNPLNIFSEKRLQEPKLDFNQLLKKYEGQASAYAKFPDGYYATPDEKVRILVAYMPGKGIEAAHQLRSAIDQAITNLNPKAYAPDMEIRFTGNIQNLIEENAALIADLVASTIIVLLLVTAAMLLFYRSLLATMALVWSLFMGTFWTFGVAYFAVGYLNANSAFLASIVVGNGINFGIILLARYLEEVRKGGEHDQAISLSMTATATSTWTAALAAGLSYGSLILTDFRGFKQFGVIGLFGMILCWISAYTLMPAYLTFFSLIRKGTPITSSARQARFAGWIASGVEKFPLLIWGTSLILLISSVLAFRNIREGVIEVDLNALRDKWSMEKGSGYYSKYIDDVFQHGLSPMVILPHSREQARRIAAAFKAKKAAEGKDTLFTTVQNLDDFIPDDQSKKITLLKEIRGQLPPKVIERLPSADKNLISTFLKPEGFQPFTDLNLPPTLFGKFKEKDGSYGKMVLVDKVLGHGTDRIDVQIPFVQEVRQIVDSVAPGTPIAGQLPVTADMIEAVMRDGPRATLFAFLAVLVLVVLLFRRIRVIGQVLFALILGILWLAGAILGFHLKINFLNFIALPITFGIGIDYGVNIFQRYREEGEGTIANVVRNTGGAVLLSSLTTIIGYSSLLIAGNQAFVSFGRLAVLGEITCVVAAVISMPAFLRYLEVRKKPSASAADAQQNDHCVTA